MDYEDLSYSELRQLVAERNIQVRGDARTKKNLLAALEAADERERDEQAQAEVSESETEPKTELERQLAGMVPGMKQRMRFGRDYTRSHNIVEDMMRVRNLPAEYAYGWAGLTAANGEDVGRWTSLGWVRVTSDMVTSDPNVDNKIYVASYEDWNGYVRHKDTVLVIANRRLLEDRKQGYTRDWNQKVEKTYGKRGELTKDRVGDPANSSGRSYKRTAQWKAEELLEGGN